MSDGLRDDRWKYVIFQGKGKGEGYLFKLFVILSHCSMVHVTYQLGENSGLEEWGPFKLIRKTCLVFRVVVRVTYQCDSIIA